MFWRQDPGPCPVCGAAHTACTGTPGPLVVVQLPARDAATTRGAELPSPAPPPVSDVSPAPAAPAPAPLRAEQVQATLGPNEVTTATYKRKRR